MFGWFKKVAHPVTKLQCLCRSVNVFYSSPSDVLEMIPTDCIDWFLMIILVSKNKNKNKIKVELQDENGYVVHQLITSLSAESEWVFSF